MNCRDLREQFSAYLDGELPREEAQAISRHVEGCVECARELDDLRRTIEALADLPVIQAPEGLKTKILAQLEVESGGGQGRKVSHLRLLWPAAAAIVVAVLLAWQGGMFESRKQAIRPVVASARRRIAHDEEMPDARPEGKEAFRATPTMSAAPTEKSKMVFDDGLKKERVTGKGGYAFNEKGGQGVSQPGVALESEPQILAEKADKGGVSRIAGTWSVPSGNPAAARALVAKLLDKRMMKQLRSAKELREKDRALGFSRVAGETAPVELEITRAEWAGLVAALEKNGMIPTRKVVAQKALPSRAVARKREALRALAKQSDADNNDMDGEAAEKVRADKVQAQAKPMDAYGGDAKSAVVEEKEAQGPAAKSLAKSESPQRFRVRLLFPLVSSE